jgi:hypothetical protein
MRFRIDVRIIGAVLLAQAGAAAAQVTAPSAPSCDNCGVITSIRT